MNNKKVTTERIFLRGAGGTGKSTVVDRITELVAFIGRRYWLRKCAYTGKAATGISGWTISSLIRESRGARSLMTNAKRAALVSELGSVKLLIIDEISTVSQHLFRNLDYAFKVAKGNTGELFGGVTVLFCGDFSQCNPTGGRSLIRGAGISGIGMQLLLKGKKFD